MRTLFTAAILVSFATHAAPSRKLGAKDDEPQLAPIAQKLTTTAPAGKDVALMRGVLFAFEPAPIEVRVQAIEDLGLLGDRRALNPLAQLTLDGNPQIARAAVRAIGLMRSPRSEEILRNIINHPAPLESTRLLALQLLPFQNSVSSVRFMNQLVRSQGISLNIQNTVRALLMDMPIIPGVSQ